MLGHDISVALLLTKKEVNKPFLHLGQFRIRARATEECVRFLIESKRMTDSWLLRHYVVHLNAYRLPLLQFMIKHQGK